MSAQSKNKILNKMIFICSFCMFLMFSEASGQNISVLEARLQKTNNRFIRESSILDSLKQVMDKRVKQIDSEKNKSGYDESLVKNLMASSVTVSNMIDEQQKKVNGVETEMDNLKRLLERKYSTAIDSLSLLEKSGKYEGDKDELRAQILRLTEKKILVTPRVNSLSFKPDIILSLNPSTAKTPEEKKLYYEYLENALAEVENKLKQTKNMNDEVKQIISLQRKTNKFLEEAEFGADAGIATLTFSNQANYNRPNSDQPGNTFIGTDQEAASRSLQVQTYFYILQQLDFKKQPGITANEIHSDVAGKKNISLQEYSQILDQVENRLAEYKTVLENKIGSGK